MPILYGGEIAQFLDVCAVDEALDFIEWLRGQSRPKIDLESCTHLHTALFQLIVAMQPEINSLPGNPFLFRCLSEAARIYPPAQKCLVSESVSRGGDS
ncbi:MAG: hypothetical protein HQL37_09850 [Alphaproteobacteria bacterium]|nr:hypothetical protein [Alphaproteobacteria bacterium]